MPMAGLGEPGELVVRFDELEVRPLAPKPSTQGIE